MQDIHFTMTMDKASPMLFLACATGEHIKTGILTCRKAGEEQLEYPEDQADRHLGEPLSDRRQCPRR